MLSQNILEKLLNLPDVSTQRQFLESHISALDDDLALTLKEYADQFLRTDIHASLKTASLLMQLPRLTGNPLHRALGLLAEANAQSIGLGNYQRAVELYNEAAQLYGAHGKHVEVARCQVGKIWALACLGRTDEAVSTYEWATQVLEEAKAWQPLATMTMNMAAVYSRLGDDARSLEMFERAQAIYEQLGEAGRSGWALAEQNRAVILRSLGRFEDSIRASENALSRFRRLGLKVEAARAKQNLAITYFVLGRYNEALDLLGRARDVFQADGRQRDTARIELFISDCLLQLRRYGDALAKSEEARVHFDKLESRLEVGQAIVNRGIAYAGLRRFDEAIASLTEARRLFLEEGNAVLVADADLEIAVVQIRQGQLRQGLATAEACADVFRKRQLPVKEAQAHTIGAKAAIRLDDIDRAQQLANLALRLLADHHVPALEFQCLHILGKVDARSGRPSEALAEYERAIEELELLRGSLMIEHRADFLEGKQEIYEDAVLLCLDIGQPAVGLDYAERAKSRALVDMLAFRMDLGIQARSAEDQPLVEKLMALRAERDRLYRRWESREAALETGKSLDEIRHGLQQDIAGKEQQITALWHELLIRNADYAQDAALWQVRTEPVQPYLDPDTVLVEYFMGRGELIAFLVTQTNIEARRLETKISDIQRFSRLLWLNLRAVPRSPASAIDSLRTNAEGVLQRLYQLLVAPFRDDLADFQHLIIVPHGILHYLPFHALHDGGGYLLEQFEISYLPGASVLGYCTQPRPSDGAILVAGHSHHGHLPHAVEEASAIAALLGEQPLLEEDVTLSAFKDATAKCRALHLAAHGEFRPDNAVFSGLALADGWLTTLDIFGLRLNASLVTLSGCQTGRNVIAGGDELIGLMRAFLYAGSASLVLTLWAVEDRSTARVMQLFYRNLMKGERKATALRQAQLRLVHATTAADAIYNHPYFWAPFFLVGDSGVF
jgi:CHAT domain-containing protein